MTEDERIEIESAIYWLTRPVAGTRDEDIIQKQNDLMAHAIEKLSSIL